jgi:hypothetical protein
MTAQPPSLQARVQALLAQGALEEAEALLQPLRGAGSGPIPLWHLLALVIRQQGRITEARAIQQMLVDAVPGDLTGRFALAETLLLLGEFERGWREYRYRYNLAHTTQLGRKVQRPQWEGESIPGRTLLIHDEQGFGDTFQFMRLVRLAKERSGARIILEVNPETLNLAERSLDILDGIVPRGQLPPAFDVHCQLMSLPLALGLRLEDLPGPMPYLRPDENRLKRWRKRLAALPRPVVALAWAGRPAHPNDANRSLDLASLAPLAAAKGSFVSIQKGPAAAQANTPPAGMALTSLSDEITDFDDTAAILCLADLLISVDSAPTHLAGALGRPAWVMLPFIPDWRWLMDRDDTPWYPRHRLFRQPRRCDWGPVIAAMAATLRDIV